MVGANSEIFSRRRFKIKSYDYDQSLKVFLFTDGVTECESASKTMYSDKRLQNLVQKDLVQKNTKDGLKALKEDLVRFRGGAPLKDDVTAVMVAI